MGRQLDKRSDRWEDKKIDGQKDGLMDGLMDGQTGGPKSVVYRHNSTNTNIGNNRQSVIDST
jgi:hypothetical protein